MLPHGFIKSEMGADQKELAHYEGLQDFLYEAEVPGRHLSGRICLHSFRSFIRRDFYRFSSREVMKHMKISASLDKGTPNMALASMFYVISSPPSRQPGFL